jgi:hypothetical protein
MIGPEREEGECRTHSEKFDKERLKGKQTKRVKRKRNERKMEKEV